MSNARATLATVVLAGSTLLAAILGPRAGSPDPAIMITVLFASLVSSIAGFAFSAVCGGILFHLWEDQLRIVQLMLACSIANQAAMVVGLRTSIRWRGLAPVLLGGFCGVPLGAMILRHLDRSWFGDAIGVALIVYAGFMAAAGRRKQTQASPLADMVVGFAGGIVGAATALPSLPLTVWCQIRGRDKAASRAVIQPFILAMQLASFAWTQATDPSHGLSALPDLLCIPAALFGTHVGLGCYRGLSERQFAIAVASLLLVCGLGFLV